MIRIQNTGVFIILLTIFETLVTDQDFNHPHQSHLYPGKCRNVRHSHLGKRQKDKKYLNRSRGSQAKWELAAFPHKSPSIADYIIGVHLFTQIWFIKVFFLTQIQYELIYPSQHQNLPPTLEIIFRNFSKFFIIFNIFKKILKFWISSQNF